MPSGEVVDSPTDSWSFKPATRIWKNSSRLRLKIARNFTRSRSGRSLSSASASTRALKSSQESSRLAKRLGGGTAASGVDRATCASLTMGRILAVGERWGFEWYFTPRCHATAIRSWKMSPMTTVEAVLTVAVGLGAGVLSGLFGVGGGIVMTPGLSAVGVWRPSWRSPRPCP